MSEPVTRATFTPQTGNRSPIEVHFNPVSLQISITNTLEDKGKGDDKKQFISKTAATLTMELIFDTTNKGSDVRLDTQKIAQFMEPGKEPGEQKIPTIVLFEWGTFKFQGLIASYRETIDFFSSDGVPLRASINLTMSRQEEVFEPSPQPPRDSSIQVSGGVGISASAVASLGGAPGAGRAIAAFNDQDSLRFSSGAFTLDASIQLGSPIAFASGGAGLSGGIGIGGGIGISGGVEVSGDVGISSGVGVSIGGSASAGVSASDGAFSGLRVSSTLNPTVQIETQRFIQPSESVGFATSRNASFQVGGQAEIEGSASLSTNVRSRSRIQFEED